MELRKYVLAAAIAAGPGLLHAQFDFKLAGRDVQVHSFASQGFAYSNENNYLTMKTSDGSFAMTDGGVNLSTQITEKFRVGAQAYDRSIGVFGKGRVTLDWALGDYRFKSWFGVRAGKVKTTLGLYNDTQDLEFLHTWAILPQSAYALDLRASTIAHTGVDVYGSFGLKRRGNLAYTAYVGSRSDDSTGGYRYGLKSFGINLNGVTGRLNGGDVRWNNPIEGLVLGISYLSSPMSTTGTINSAGLPKNSAYAIEARDNTFAYYVQYKAHNLTVDGEYRRETVAGPAVVTPFPGVNIRSSYSFDERGWYIAAAYRVHKRLEFGTYRSLYVPVWGGNHDLANDHIRDQAVTARVDLAKFWDIKIEGHFMDGYGAPQALRGFYPATNPQGLKPQTNMLVIRTGFSF